MPGTPSAWETPPPARSPRRLSIKGGFCVDGGQHHQLDQQARRLGFANLRSCLEALLDDGWSVPSSLTILAPTQAAIRRAITDYRIPRPPRRQQLARQRQHKAHQRAATRVAELGFAGVRAYLADRLATRAWTLVAVAAELGAARGTLRRLLDQHKIRRVAPTRRQRAAAKAARRPSSRRGRPGGARHAWPSLASPRWTTTCGTAMWGGAGRCGRRLGAELGVGHGWLDQQLTRLGLRDPDCRLSGTVVRRFEQAR